MAQGTIRFLKFDIPLADESRVFAFDFKNNLQTGDTIITQSVNQSGGTPLTFTGATIVGTQVKLRITGGAVNTLYNLSCTVTTTLGDTLVASGGLQTIGSV